MKADPTVMPLRSSTAVSLLAIVALILAQIITLHLMGRYAICPCGEIRLWYGNTHGPENSQQITDWYTFSHIIHGFVFYGLSHLALPRVPWLPRLALAVGVEVGWELLENSPLVIERYRQTAAIGYSGDSILNSVSDVSSMIIGFVLARRLPAMLTVGIAIVLEVVVGLHIRDNLTLNVIMLIHPFDTIKAWQAGPPII